MNDYTIMDDSPIGQRIRAIGNADILSYLVFNKKRIRLVAKITIGRSADNNVVIENKLASRYHALIQKIKEDYYLKDENSTNGTFLNGIRIPSEKYMKLTHGDKIQIGSATLVFGMKSGTRN